MAERLSRQPAVSCEVAGLQGQTLRRRLHLLVRDHLRRYQTRAPIGVTIVPGHPPPATWRTVVSFSLAERDAKSP